MHFPVLVLVPDAATPEDAYRQAGAAMEPFCGDPAAHSIGDPAPADIRDAVAHFQRRPIIVRRDAATPTTWHAPSGADGTAQRLLSTTGKTIPRTDLDPGHLAWLTAAIGLWMANDAAHYRYDDTTGTFTQANHCLVQCDSWVLGGQYANTLCLHRPVPVTVVEHAWGVIEPPASLTVTRRGQAPGPGTTMAAASVSEPRRDARAGLGTPDGAMVLDARTFRYDYDWQAASRPLDPQATADLARRSDITTSSLIDLLDRPACVLTNGTWTAISPRPAGTAAAQAAATACDAVINATPDTYIAVLDAHA